MMFQLILIACVSCVAASPFNGITSGVPGNGLNTNIHHGFNNGFNAFNNHNHGTGLNTVGHINNHNLGNGFSTFGHSGTNVFGHNKFGQVCPNQTDLVEGLRLNPDPTGYPVNQIAAELAARPDLANCLLRELVPETAPAVPTDPILVSAKPTCPFLETALQSFFRYNGQCWILRQFQEVIRYVTCLTRQCTICGKNNHGFGESPFQCIKEYQYVSVWAFCQGLPNLQQISRERVILPVSCSCNKLRCFANDGHH